MRQADLQERLSELSEPSYRIFQEKLQISSGTLYGVRAPSLQRLAREIAKDDAFLCFDELLDQDTLSYEETIILYKLFGTITLSSRQRLEYLPRMLHYNTSWATNDSLASEMKWIKKDREAFYSYFCTLLNHDEPYAIRLGIVVLMLYYLEPSTIQEVRKALSQVQSDHYYVTMALAWAYATAFCKDREGTLPYLHYGILTEPVRKKAIQKCRESRLVSEEDKAMLKMLTRAPSTH